MTESSLLHKLFEHKAWANDEIFEAVSRVDDQAYGSERHTAIRLLNHLYVVDRIFASHLGGVTHSFDSTNTVDTPALSELAEWVAALDQWYVSYVQNVEKSHLCEQLSFTFTDGSPGRMSREEMLIHVAMHGSYHRGAVGRILNQLAIAPPRDIFTGYLHRAEPFRRGAGG